MEGKAINRRWAQSYRPRRPPDPGPVRAGARVSWPARMSVFTGNELLIQSCCCEVEPEKNRKDQELASARDLQNWNMHFLKFSAQNMP